MRNFILVSTLLLVPAFAGQAQQDTTEHEMMDHHNTTIHKIGESTDTPLTEPGNDIFGTIQEVIKKLENNSNTDWSKVDIEALRQHLLDMKVMTEHTKVVDRKTMKNGVRITVQPTTERAKEALKRVFDAHPAMLKKETGWIMKVNKNEEQYILNVTTNNPDEVDKIRGLGYIGLMAYGKHHQKHHWMMATDRNPHSSP